MADFAVKYDPKVDTPETVGKKILYSLTVHRLHKRKPAIFFVGGMSGEGKSVSGGLGLASVILEAQGININDFKEEINIFDPLEYTQKIDDLLTKKELKNVNVAIIHEARLIVKSSQWHSFLNMAIADINAMIRGVKRMCFIIISQSIADIDKATRRTINYYGTISRPMSGIHASYQLRKLYSDERDLENIKLKGKRLFGFLVHPNGRYQPYIVNAIDIKLPNKELIEWFDKRDNEKKKLVIRKQLSKLNKELQKTIGIETKKLDLIVDQIAANPDLLKTIGKRWFGKYKLQKNVAQLYDLSKEEAELLQSKLNERFKIEQPRFD